MVPRNNHLPLFIPGPKRSHKEVPPPSQRIRTDLNFMMGTVASVDPVKQVICVSCKDGVGPLIDIHITHPFSGNSSYIMGMPEEGCEVLLANRDGDYYPIAYIPRYALGLEAKNVKKWSDGIQTNSRNNFFYRVRSLQQGEIAISSKDGLELFLSDYALLEDKAGNYISINEVDKSIVSASCSNNYVFSSGLWVAGGIIRRNSIDASDAKDIPNVKRENYLKGKYSYVLRPGNSDAITEPYFTEYLIEVEDRAFKQPSYNDINRTNNLTIRQPVIIQSMGNFVGNNPQTDFYGRLLRVVVFHSPDDDSGDFSLEPISGLDNDTIGMAYALYKPKRANPEQGAFFGIDKEGHFFQYIPSATGGGLGNGRSMSVVARGSLKEIWGADSYKGNSWDLKTDGGIRWKVGRHNNRDGNPYSGRSIDIRADGGSFTLLGAGLVPEIQNFDNTKKTVTDTSNYFKIEKVAGDERVEIGKTRETIIRANDRLRIDGQKTEEIGGAMSLNVGTSISVHGGDNYSEVVKQVKEEKYGSRSTSVDKGGVETKVTSLYGNIKEEIRLKGDKITRVALGGLKETLAKSRNTKIIKGRYNVSIVSGNANISTLNGQILNETKRGKISIKSTSGAIIKTLPASKISVQGGSILIKGKTGLASGAITGRSHNDYTTGAFLRGSRSVTITV